MGGDSWDPDDPPERLAYKKEKWAFQRELGLNIEGVHVRGLSLNLDSIDSHQGVPDTYHMMRSFIQGENHPKKKWRTIQETDGLTTGPQSAIQLFFGAHQAFIPEEQNGCAHQTDTYMYVNILS